MYTTYRLFNYYLLIFFLLLCTSCTHRSSRIKKKITIPHPPLHIEKQASTSEVPAITIWVHGTRLLRRPIFRNFFESKPSIKPVLYLDQSYHLRTIADTLSDRNPDKFPLETFYVFGWSGKLSAQERVQAAHYLAHDLNKLIIDYQTIYHTYPSITIIAHSHGGNVVLNLATLPDLSQNIRIEDLILLAVPVQEKTKHLISASLFHKIHVLYSTLDLIQVLAPQIVNGSFDAQGHVNYKFNIPPFSARCFNPQPNLIQVGIKMNNRALMHTEFCSPRFLQLLPDILTIADTWYQQENTFFDKERLLCIYSHQRSKKIIIA